MKTFLFLLIFSSTFACKFSDQAKTDATAQIEIVAKDPLFHEYQMAHLEHQMDLSEGKFDLLKIQSLVGSGQWPDCSNSSPNLPDIKGIGLYWNTMCEKSRYMNQLKSKYPEVFSGDAEIIKKLMDHYSQNNEEFQAAFNKNLQEQTRIHLGD